MVVLLLCEIISQGFIILATGSSYNALHNMSAQSDYLEQEMEKQYDSQFYLIPSTGVKLLRILPRADY